MAIICPTITAYDAHEYRAQMERVEPFAKRIHIDLMDGRFAPRASVDLEHVWWPHAITADIHLMYQWPMNYIDQLIKLKPNLVVIHNEAEVHHMDFAARLHREGIKAGLALLQDTPAEYAYQIMHSFDQVMVFSGNLGEHGGAADMHLLDKVRQVREHAPEAEISWDGGINDQNAKTLSEASVDVLNVGGFIQKSDDTHKAYEQIQLSLEQKYDNFRTTL